PAGLSRSLRPVLAIILFEQPRRTENPIRHHDREIPRLPRQIAIDQREPPDFRMPRIPRNSQRDLRNPGGRPGRRKDVRMPGHLDSHRAQSFLRPRRLTPLRHEIEIARRGRAGPADRMAILAQHHHGLELRADDAAAGQFQVGPVLHVHAGHVDLPAVAPLTRGRQNVGLECRRMAYLRMVPVKQVVNRDLPVAFDHELLDPRNHLHVPAQRDQVETEPAGRTQKLLERRRTRIVRAEDEPLVRGDLRDLRKPAALLVELAAVEDVEAGNAVQLPVDPIRPSVVRTQKAPRIALLRPAHGVAAMRARVEHRPYRAVALAHHQHVVAPHHRLEKVARLRNLRLVTKKQPRAREYPLHLQLEDLRIAVDAAVNLPSLQRDHFVDFGTRQSHTNSSPKMRAMAPDCPLPAMPGRSPVSTNRAFIETPRSSGLTARNPSSPSCPRRSMPPDSPGAPKFRPPR